MNSLHIAQVVSATRATVARLQAENPDTDADALLALVETEEPAFNDVMTALCRAHDEAVHEVEKLDKRIDNLTKRKQRFDAKREEYHRLIYAALHASQQRKWQSPEATAWFQNPGRPSVVITDPAAIPNDFIRIRREPDKLAIGSALASGATVPGAELRNSAPSLHIKVT